VATQARLFRVTASEHRRSLCSICRGHRRLCGKPVCPILAKAEALMRLERSLSKETIFGSSPPAVFVGSWNYPRVLAGPLVPPLSAVDTSVMDLPEMWMGKSLDEILRYRLTLVRGKHPILVQSASHPARLLSTFQEVVMASKPTDTEMWFEKKPNLSIVFSPREPTSGPSGSIRRALLAENPKVLLPVIVGLDGFTLSHTLENVQVLSDDVIKKFVGTRQFPLMVGHEGKTVSFKLDPENPITIGPLALQDYYFEFKRQQEDAMKNALKTIMQVHDEYAQISGRNYGDGLLDPYYLEDAEIAIICLGSTAGTVKTVVNNLRAEGVKAGMLRIRTFRPLPVEGILKTLEKVKAVAVMDRSMSFGGRGGPVFNETRHALYDALAHPYVVNYIYGLGGRDTSPSQIRDIYKDLQRILQAQRVEDSIKYVGLRE